MHSRHLGPVRRFSISVLGLTLAVLASTGSADARRHHGFAHVHHRPGPRHARAFSLVDSPGFSAMVVDAGSGRTLYASNENALRHPASITKVMTLYLLFEKLDSGDIRLDSRIPVSAHAASQAPTKLGLRPGSTIAVEDAIKAIVTKSANDMAVAVAEAIGGDEASFAAMMTRKAHALGMSRTIYVNASGLPDDRQLTTARDLTVLGRSIHERFPSYYRFFSTPSFTYAGSTMPNHNHLLGRIQGMDGIKTGYTRASGFNLLSSVSRGGHRIVSVVLGGHTAASRDRIMASLIEDHIEEAAPTRVADAVAPSPVETAAPTPAAMDMADNGEDDVPDAEPGPNLIAPTMAVPAPRTTRPNDRAQTPRDLATDHARGPLDRPRPAFIAGAPKLDPAHLPSPLSLAERRRLVLDGSTTSSTTARSGSTAVALATSTPSTIRSAPRAAQVATTAPGAASRPDTAARTRADDQRVEASGARERSTSATGHDWLIQVGATDAADKATDLLDRARSQGRSALAAARPFTEKVRRGGTTLYRARFAGLDTGEAEAACKTLKRSGFACFAVKD